MEQHAYRTITTTLNVPEDTWLAWVERCRRLGEDPVAAFDAAIGPLVDGLLRAMPTAPKDV